MKGNQMAKEPTALERLKELDDEQAKLNQRRNEIREAAKTEALDKVNKAIDELNALGYNYSLRDTPIGGGRARSSPGDGSRKGTRTLKTGTVCPVCKFATEPPHDGRTHKKHPAAFTDAELKERGYTRI